jgi:virginiamycin B lyase
MRATRLSILTALIFALFAFILGAPAGAQSATTAALVGQVSSAEEGPMEGVLVSARKSGSTITISVASDREGRYSFPSSKLGAGS